MLLAAASSAVAEDYLWTISASDTDPYVNSGTLPVGVVTHLYLWLACSTMGMEYTEFHAEADGMIYVAFQGAPGFLELDPGTECVELLGIGCPGGPILAGVMWVINLYDPSGTICVVPCPHTGENTTLDCNDPEWELQPNAWMGFASGGAAPCSEGFCGPVSVEDESWGRVKGLYR